MSLYVGSHVSMKAPDYLEGSIRESLSYDATACMIYTGPPRNAIRKPVEVLKMSQARELLKDQPWSFEQVIVHAPYIINLANTVDEEIHKKSMDLLKLEIERTAAIGSRILVLHPGAHVKAGLEKGMEKLISSLNEILDQDEHEVSIALETMCGKGSEIGGSFEEIARIIQGVNKSERLSVCLDTCHLHDAGYDMEKFDEVLREFDRVIGLEKLAVIHLNNSKNERGARKDRHENLAYGKIPLYALKQVFDHPALKETVMILETPHRDDKPIYKEEIAILREEEKLE